MTPADLAAIRARQQRQAAVRDWDSDGVFNAFMLALEDRGALLDALDEKDKALKTSDEIIQNAARAVEALATDQAQADEEGVIVTVSRQAADEVCEAMNRIAVIIRAALTKDGGK